MYIHVHLYVCGTHEGSIILFVLYLSRRVYEDEEEIISETQSSIRVNMPKVTILACQMYLSLSLRICIKVVVFLLGRYLRTLTRQENALDLELKGIQRKSYGLKERYLWKHPKQRSAML